MAAADLAEGVEVNPVAVAAVGVLAAAVEPPNPKPVEAVVVAAGACAEAWPGAAPPPNAKPDVAAGAGVDAGVESPPPRPENPVEAGAVAFGGAGVPSLQDKI